VSLSRLDNPPGMTIPRGSKPSLRGVANEPPGADGGPVLAVEPVDRFAE
jgi:hypothetical protein